VLLASISYALICYCEVSLPHGLAFPDRGTWSRSSGSEFCGFRSRRPSVPAHFYNSVKRIWLGTSGAFVTGRVGFAHTPMVSLTYSRWLLSTVARLRMSRHEWRGKHSKSHSTVTGQAILPNGLRLTHGI
jgi:hypothetical protein